MFADRRTYPGVGMAIIRNAVYEQMGTRGDHDDGFDRDRWRASVADRTLYVTVGGEQGDSPGDDVGHESAECGLCDETVLPITDDGTACCPICGFAVGGQDAALRPSDRIGSR